MNTPYREAQYFHPLFYAGSGGGGPNEAPGFSETPEVVPTRDPAVSVGLRVGERPGLYAWGGAAVMGLLVLLLKDVEFGL